MKTNNNNQPALSTIEPDNSPLVKPSEVSGGDKPDAAEKALTQLRISDGLAAILERNNNADAVRLIHRDMIAQSIAGYWTAIDETKAHSDNWEGAKVVIETATATVSHKLADAILANALTRKEARQTMGATFGFELSKTTGKPTSKPSEPGNTIAKRVSSVTIAAEFAMTGELPDKGGDSLGLVGQERMQEILADYFAGELTVRSTSERIEQAIKDARVSIPLEMNADKLLALAGKIESAKEKIVTETDPALREAYAVLLQVIAELPFSNEE